MNLIPSDYLFRTNVFAYHVHDPERYGVVNFDAQQPISIQEKPLFIFGQSRRLLTISCVAARTKLTRRP